MTDGRWPELAQAQFENQLQVSRDCASASLQGMGMLARLHGSLVQTALHESRVMLQEMLQADPTRAQTLLQAQAAPSAVKVLAYTRHLAHIGGRVQVEWQSAALRHLQRVRDQTGAAAESASSPAESSACEALYGWVDQCCRVLNQLTAANRKSVENVESTLQQGVERWQQANASTASAFPFSAGDNGFAAKAADHERTRH